VKGVFFIEMAKHIYMWLAKGSFNSQTNLPCGERCIKYKAKNRGVLYKVQGYMVRVLYIPPFAKVPSFGWLGTNLVSWPKEKNRTHDIGHSRVATLVSLSIKRLPHGNFALLWVQYIGKYSRPSMILPNSMHNLGWEEVCKKKALMETYTYWLISRKS
jgi:hypothetical protein